MGVKRIVTNIAASELDASRTFYGTVLGLDLVMDSGWILTFAATNTRAVPQISIANKGGSGTPVQDISVEVDDCDEVLHRVTAAGLRVEYGPKQEPWGVKRFYVRDPFGRLVNVLAHVDCCAYTVAYAPAARRTFRLADDHFNLRQRFLEER